MDLIKQQFFCRMIDGLLVGEDGRVLALLPEGLAQGRGAADGVPVRAFVGENEDVVLAAQQRGRLNVVHALLLTCPAVR